MEGLWIVLRYDNEEDCPEEIAQQAVWLGSHPLFVADHMISLAKTDYVAKKEANDG